MKAILEFQLPEDNDEHFAAINGSKYRDVISSLDNKLRNKQKYQDINEISIEDARNLIYETLEEHGLFYAD